MTAVVSYAGIEVLSLGGLIVGGTPVGSVEAAARELEQQMLAASRRVVDRLQTDMTVTMRRVVADLEGRHGKSWPLSGNLWGTVPDRLASRTGMGMASIRRSLKVTRLSEDEVRGAISTGTMSVHETGATITARGKWLTLPMRAALDSRGVALGRARSFTNTFVARSRRGNLIIFRREGRDTIVPLFLLRRSVTIPPRLRLKETVAYEAGYFASKAIEAMAREFDL